MSKRSLAFGLYILFICSTLAPMSIGNNTVISNEIEIESTLSFDNREIVCPLLKLSLTVQHKGMNSNYYWNNFLNIQDFDWDSFRNTYEGNICKRKIEPFSVHKITELLNNDDNPLVIVFVNSNLLPQLEDEINVYSSTLVDVGYAAIVFETSGGTVEDLKDHIFYYWDNGFNLVGVVLIGNFPAAWYSHDEDFLCDLFLMDMDGKWIDADNDGLYDSHTDGDGDASPDIFIGRIDASKVPAIEKGKIEIYKKYLNKVHEFWVGNVPQTNFALTYTDREWSDWDALLNDIGYTYENYNAISYPNVNKNDYLNNQLSGPYEFIQLTCHSKSFGHLFDDGGLAFSNSIRSASPMALFYFLHCCHALKFTDYNCLGYAYILNTNTPSLAVIGSTKSELSRDFRYLYEPFGQGFSFGQALIKWFEHHYPYNEHDIANYYGTTILGDPTLKVYKNYRANAHGPYYNELTYPEKFYGSATGGNPPYTWFWDFGDGNTSNLKNPEHNYSSAGNYTVKFTITDSKDNSTSDITWANIKKFNNPPNPPTINGPGSGKVRKKYYFEFVAVDVDGDEWVKYIIDWGDQTIDGTLGPYKTGEVVRFYHRWNEKRMHSISAIAIDLYGNESEWSDPFPINIMRNKAAFDSNSFRFLDMISSLQRILYFIR